MTADVFVAAVAAGFCVGLVAGAALEAWGWRMSADSHQRQKSAGRWFTVHPAGDPCPCTDCTRRRLRP
jgi:hypothetical protein